MFTQQEWKPVLPDVAQESDHEVHRDKVPGWMVTFGDMMSLLLVLFAFLFSLKTLRPAKHISLASGHDGFGQPLIATIPFAQDMTGLPDLFAHQGEAPEELLKLHKVMDSLAPGTRIVINSFASRESAAATRMQVEELELSRAHSTADALERLLKWRGICPVKGDSCNDHDADKHVDTVYNIGRGSYPIYPAQEIDESGTGDTLDFVEICILSAKNGREIVRRVRF